MSQMKDEGQFVKGIGCKTEPGKGSLIGMVQQAVRGIEDFKHKIGMIELLSKIKITGYVNLLIRKEV